MPCTPVPVVAATTDLQPHVSKGEPFVVDQACESWGWAAAKWSIAHLKEHYGHELVSVNLEASRAGALGGQRREMSLRDYFDSFTEGEKDDEGDEYRNMCMHMCIDMCRDMHIDMCIGMHIDVYRCAHMSIQMSTHRSMLTCV